jgi:hypothetical protein
MKEPCIKIEVTACCSALLLGADGVYFEVINSFRSYQLSSRIPSAASLAAPTVKVAESLTSRTSV